MQVSVNPGKYVLAVSGGVDSMVLLDLLSKQKDIKLVIAHFNHGIRGDSNKDEELVLNAAKSYNLQVEIGIGNLSNKTSESIARQARYKFLHAIKDKYKVKNIITAHHQDDLIETAFINILRGTGRRGLTAISSNLEVIRPLLSVPKSEIQQYATARKVKWLEDSTNENTDYLRNYIRKYIMPKLSASERLKIIKNAEKVANNDNELNNIIATISHNIFIKGIINRSKFVTLPINIEKELVTYWLRELDFKEYDKKTVDRVLLALKTGIPGKKYPIRKDIWLLVNSKTAEFSATS
jgi:tRNA(Ile)-lysidine synthase